jgi:CBS domain containing-hemolysin-like protein
MQNKIKGSIKFSLTIAVITFVLAAIFSSFSSSVMNSVSWIFGLAIVFFIVCIGIAFDMLGIASAAAKEAPLHAMAAEKVKGAKEAVLIHKHADKFASFCNDVIGDISGIVSGSALTIVVIEISTILRGDGETSIQIILSIVLTSFIASLTVGGKALGKYFAIHSSTGIILFTGKIIYVMENKLKMRVLPKGKTKNKAKKE